jgi:hypothetical protein
MSSDKSFMQHGQFIAKIIQHMAPGAQLTLIRVLDDYGGTDLRSIIYGLWLVSRAGNASSTIVNMSLTLEPPTECLEYLTLHGGTGEPGHDVTDLINTLPPDGPTS